MSLVTIKRRAEGMTIEGEVFEKMDFRSMRAFAAKFIKCRFFECQMGLSDLRNSKFDDCEFIACGMQRVDFGAATIERTSFTECDLEQASFMGAYMAGVEFEDCRMCYGETLFQNVTVAERMHLKSCNFHGSSLDFREVRKDSLRFTDCNLWSAKTSFGCAFWKADFDERTMKRFIAMVARRYPVNDTRMTLIELAGEEYPVVDRAMREVEK